MVIRLKTGEEIFTDTIIPDEYGRIWYNDNGKMYSLSVIDIQNITDYSDYEYEEEEEDDES